MGYFWKLTLFGLGALILSACETYPYSAAYDLCDRDAGACYQYCEQYEDGPDIGACRADCDAQANQCFAQAYDGYRYSSAFAVYGYSASPWYGSYGSWHPGHGYAFGNNYYRGRSYGYSNNHGRHGRGYGRYGGRGDSNGDAGANAPLDRNTGPDGEPRQTRSRNDPSVQDRGAQDRGVQDRGAQDRGLAPPPRPSDQRQAAPPRARDQGERTRRTKRQRSRARPGASEDNKNTQDR